MILGAQEASMIFSPGQLFARMFACSRISRRRPVTDPAPTNRRLNERLQQTCCGVDFLVFISSAHHRNRSGAHQPASESQPNNRVPAKRTTVEIFISLPLLLMLLLFAGVVLLLLLPLPLPCPSLAFVSSKEQRAGVVLVRAAHNTTDTPQQLSPPTKPAATTIPE